MEPITAIGGIMSILKKGFDIRKDVRNSKIVFNLSVKWFGVSTQTGNNILVRASVTNKSEKPYTIDAVELDVNGKQYKPVHITEAKKISNEIVNIITLQNHGLFRLDGLDDITVFPSDAYLLPNQSVSGLILYDTGAPVSSVGSAAARLYIAGYDFDLIQNIL